MMVYNYIIILAETRNNVAVIMILFYLLCVFNLCSVTTSTQNPTATGFTTPLQLTSHPSSHHSPLSLLTIPLTPPQTTPTYDPSNHSPAPSSYHSKFLTTPPHCSPQCSRDPQQCCGDDLIFNLQPLPFQSVQHQYTKPPNESLMALQLAKLAKFMKEQL